MTLDLSSLKRSIAQLEEALFYCGSDVALADDRLALHLRAGAIQAFEFTYEVCFKMLKRYLEMTEPDGASADQMTFHELIRTGYEKGLLSSELSVWKEYRKERGTTSHTYDEEKAEAVFEDIPAFLVDGQYLLSQLAQRQSKED